MADFSAVIRRAIEGLSTNTPEDRGRIYARARATIQRQLDSLPEGMNHSIFEAQLVKIENSILEIEQEYADSVSESSTQAALSKQSQPDEHSLEPPVNGATSQVETVVTQPKVGVDPSVRQSVAAPNIIQSPVELPVAPPTEAAAALPVVEEVVVAQEPEPIVEEPIVEFPEVSPSTLKDGRSEEGDTSESIEVLAPTRFGDLKFGENAIDSELQIPEAPQSESIWPDVPVVPQEAIIETQNGPEKHASLGRQVGSSATTTDNDTNLIDQAVSEIRSTLQEDTPDNSSLPDPNLSFGFGEEALPDAPLLKQRKSPIVIIIAILLLLFVALTFFFWRMGWQGVQNLLPESTQEVSENLSVTQPAEQPEQIDQNAEKAADTDDVAAVNGEVEKFTQRLNSDGSEIDEGPASDLIDGLPNEEGRSVASADASDDTVAQGEPIAAQADADAPTLQRMFFYETSLGLEQQARYEGSVVWSEKTESDFEKSRPYIEGIIQVPERDVSIIMTIKLNGDETLPVSHLIDLNFSLPEEFDGGEIEQITEVKFKSSEEQTGDRLEAISAKIDTSFFVVGLQNDKLDVVESNLQLMSQRGWIDIPISYTNGRKALITLEKGAAGKVIFDKVLASWKQNPIE